jgi:2-oxoglutarate ferredoxin oxidoreductase subunit alpha
MYTADGLEHGRDGTPSSMAADHLAQLDKRRRKLSGFDFGAHWAEVYGEGPTCLLTWGSSAGAVREAAQRLAAAGRPVRVVALRLLAPLRRNALAAVLEGASRILVIEQNQGAQLFHYLLGEQALPPHARPLARPGPLPLRPGAIVDAALAED